MPDRRPDHLGASSELDADAVAAARAAFPNSVTDQLRFVNGWLIADGTASREIPETMQGDPAFVAGWEAQRRQHVVLIRHRNFGREGTCTGCRGQLRRYDAASISTADASRIYCDRCATSGRAMEIEEERRG